MSPNEPSRTALVVAGGVLLASRDPRLSALVKPEAARLSRLMLDASNAGRRLLRWIDGRIGPSLLRTLERCTIPGIVEHWVCRKRWLENAWRDAQRDGFDSLIVLGSGFDTLSLRAPRNVGETVRALDVDHPATLAVRQHALASVIPAQHDFAAHDLSRAGLAHAVETRIPSQAAAFVLIEGVLMYLEPARVDQLFAELAALRFRRLRVGFTFMEQSPGSSPTFRPASRLVDCWLSRRQEPFRSGIDPAQLSDWLEKRAFRLLDWSAAPGREGVAHNPLRGESAAVAERTTS